MKRGKIFGIKSRGESIHACPYDPTHVLTNSRISEHVQKCRDNFFLDMDKKGVPVEYAVCRYSQIHKVPIIELGYHEEWCPNKDRPVEEILVKEFGKMSQAQALAQAGEGVEEDAIVEPERNEPVRPSQESCPSSLIGGTLPPEDHLLTRELVPGYLNRVRAEQHEKFRKERHEAIKNAYLEPIQRSPVDAVQSTAEAIAQYEEEKKKQERKKQQNAGRKQKFEQDGKHEFWEAFEKRKQEQAALAAQKKKESEDEERKRTGDLN